MPSEIIENVVPDRLVVTYPNKIPNVNPAMPPTKGTSDKGMKNVLLADRGGFDGSLPTSFNAGQGLTYLPSTQRSVVTYPSRIN
jgi:hypothetical protein